MPIALWALAIGAFGIGTTEFVIMGLLPDLAVSLDVRLSSAGFLVTGYALGVFVGAPIVTPLVSRLPRKPVLIGLMLLFTVGNLACALAPSYYPLLAARVLTSFAHGAFFGIGAVVATSLVPANKKASAIALMFTGLTLANVLGVPAGTWLGQHFGWRSTFWAVTGVGMLAMLAVALWVPTSHQGRRTHFAQELSALMHPQVLLSFLITTLGFGGVFVTLTYIAPILTQLTGFPPAAVSPILLLFGVGLVIGNVLGGKFADANLMNALFGTLLILTLVQALFAYTAHDKIPTLITVLLLGIAGFSTVPPLQMRVLEKAAAAPNLASAFNIAAFNLGNAGGAWVGGLTIDHGPGLAALPWVASLMTASSLIVAGISWQVDHRKKAPRS
jgi:DHA1 family inner membrane transport protein